DGIRDLIVTGVQTCALPICAGLVFSPGAGGRTVFRGGFGVFYDRVPLLAGDFINNPERTVTQFDPLGNPLGPPLTFHNAYIKVRSEERRVGKECRRWCTRET